MFKVLWIILFYFLSNNTILEAQHSVARRWNEEVLKAIRNDYARPTVHARNLFHTSVAMYDAWAAFEPSADTYLLGKSVHGFAVPFQLLLSPVDIQKAQEKAISFAVYRLIKARFKNAPAVEEIYASCDQLMLDLGYDTNIQSTNYHCGAAELGNFIASQIITYGLQDGSNEQNDYRNVHYRPSNLPLLIESPGNPSIADLNKWQPLLFSQFIDQSGNSSGNLPDFIGPEWGSVLPFSLKNADASIFIKDGYMYKVYHDPGPPVLINDSDSFYIGSYQWMHAMVAVWSSHLNPNDSTLWDISPASLGNISDYPIELEDYDDFYIYQNGGDIGSGHQINPNTGLTYQSNLVKRSDYTRVLAEFWADGPDSETPPGHWFVLLNGVSDHPALVKKLEGTGPTLSDLEWDIKAYFILGGAMHDAAIAAWGIKGWYDYIRPVSSIRAMAEKGQCSDSSLSNFHPMGLPLIPGHIEIIQNGDPLAGSNDEFSGDLKIYAWKGPDFIINPQTDFAGVDWIRAKEWWPYQRPSFVTPPFAGYVSGHSTFSRAAAEVLTALTGDHFFPGGIGEFYCPMNNFLVFENGPSADVTLQWATYQDAADQCSLSRIWGGIHPPIDDIPGRLIGQKIGLNAFDFALPYFNNQVEDFEFEKAAVFPNPSYCGVFISFQYSGVLPLSVYHSNGRLVLQKNLDFMQNETYLDLRELDNGLYFVVIKDENGKPLFNTSVIKISLP